MVHAPKSKEEVEVVTDITNAGVGWISGEKFVPNPAEESRDMPSGATAQLLVLDKNFMDHRCSAVAS